MLDSIHMVLWPTVLNQAHRASDMSRDARVCCPFHTLQKSDNGFVEVGRATYFKSKEQNHGHER